LLDCSRMRFHVVFRSSFLADLIRFGLRHSDEI